MSFRDCITRQISASKDAPTVEAPQAQAAAASRTPPASSRKDAFLSKCSAGGTAATAPEGPACSVASSETAGGFCDHGEGRGIPGLLEGSNGVAEIARSDGISLQHIARRSNHSGCAASERSGVCGRGKLGHRIINASAPITFTKTFCASVQLAAFTRTPECYLNAEAVHAAAAAAEAVYENSVSSQRLTDSTIADQSKQIAGRSLGAAQRVCISQEAARQNEKQRKEAAQPVSLQRPNETMQNTGDDNTNGKRDASGCPLQTSSFGQSSRTAVVTRPMLGSWLFGSSGTSTELERLLKEESDLAENAAAKSELAATKLLQEDMEAMIANLQHVKGFLVAKLRECETALLTTAQERDDLEATLQQIQSGIQDSVATNRRQAEECKERLVHKEREVEELRAQLEQATAEVLTLKKENEILKLEVNVARVEAADVAAADGFRIEEYRLALQTLMEQNKAQRRELKRLRGQLIKTREDLASALARVDELETMEEFRRSQTRQSDMPAAPQDACPSSGLGVRGPHDNSEGRGDLHSIGGTPLDEWRAICRKHQTETQADGAPETNPSACDVADAAAFRESDRRSDDAYGNLLICTGTNSGSQGHGCTHRGKGLGRSVKGLLASGVTQLLQRIEYAISTDREPPEFSSDRESQASEDIAQPEEERGLHEEAALFLQRTSGSSDLIVPLEDGRQPESDGEDDGISPQAGDSRTLGNVARSVWQAAHGLLADRALPPARLSTLRTVAAGNPSAWEVLRERHRAAKSMPLFSSIPPTAYPLIAQAGDHRQSCSATVRQGEAASTTSRAAAASQRRGPAVQADPGAFKTRPSGRIEPVRRGVSPQGCMTVELPSGLPTCASVPLDVVESAAKLRSESSTKAASSPAIAVDLKTATATDQSTASGAAESKIPQTASFSHHSGELEESCHGLDPTETEPDDAVVFSEEADAAAEDRRLEDNRV